ncbi:tudor domain-containing protein 1 isoform X3 [Epinephelus fuscoguttatus]|uniref:tudor domain-containing protein 1 isoform X3 n=1 Tax=Epinephelus fuscoguttatus TaxID=293821 RepID=UPI0020D0FFDF|nr:tudor domain-containing protein 1 isoform X3 [Epinephelus fuscoguttatus]
MRSCIRSFILHVHTVVAMFHSFSPNLVRPNLPLRKPSSSPVVHATLSPPATAGTAHNAAPVRLALGPIGEGPLNSPVSRDQSPMSGSIPPARTVYFCNYCGNPGNFRCKRCKKTPYCSVVCQTEDWKAHRHICVCVDPEPAKEKPKETAALLMAGDGPGLPESKGDASASSLQRVFMKDLQVTKVIKGTDIQASVVEFYSPGRFFLLAQSPEVLEALQSISTELQKTYSSSPATAHVPYVGEVCAVQFSCDLNWYRGLVKSLAADQKTASILYIDFGNEEEVPVYRIRLLAANIQPFSPCAMECRVTGVVPVTDRWSGECCIFVKQMLLGKTVTVRLLETLESGRIHVVDILLSLGKKLSTLLIERGYAVEEMVNKLPTPQEINAMVSASLENFRRLSDGKDDNSWAQPPEPLTQAVGDCFSVVVTHIQSPNDIIIQKVENAGLIQELQQKLREHCCQGPAPQNFRPAPGTVCCAQFSEDKLWYRAKVLAYSSEDRVCVGYLDFGNSEEVDLGHLRPISTSLLALPMQAMPCSLAGVQPVGESWSDECLLALQRRVSNRILRVEIQGAHEGKVLVAMIDEASDPQANVGELLSSAGYAASAAPPPPPPPPTSSDQQADQTPTPAVEPHVPAPASEPLVWSETELPCDGQKVALLASVIQNPGEFYCRINNPADHRQLIELGAELKKHCEAVASPFVPKVGEPCCAMLLGDGAWYRAMVKELSENVSVTFVDYGYIIKVEKNLLRPITPRLLTLPFQAIRCWLTGVEPLGSEWSSEALLWFQNLVDGEQLSARVLSVTEQGYGVELESRGQNVAAALISEQLAKGPGASPKEMHANTGSGHQHQGTIPENEHSHVHAQASSQTGGGSKEMQTEGGTAVPSEVPSFPVDWKTTELPLNETFQPCIAAVVSPSLFYVLGLTQVDQQKLQEVMIELTSYCSNIQASLSSTVLSRPTPGAACCAQFSADNNWYRAVALEVGDNEMSVIYADYGNSEKVPFSRILPITTNLLQLPFLITRCTITGKEHFTAKLPEEIQQMFQSLLLNGVLATVKSFDGSDNVLSVSLPTEKGGGDLTAMILDALQVQAKNSPCPSTTKKAEQTDSSPPAASYPVVPECPEPKAIPTPPKSLENTQATPGLTTTPQPLPQTPQQRIHTLAASLNGWSHHNLEDPVKKIIEQMEPPGNITKTNDPQTSGCCCLNLTTKIDHLEQLVQLQLSLIKQLLGQTK